jgi:hypothetical protein
MRKKVTGKKSSFGADRLDGIGRAVELLKNTALFGPPSIAPGVLIWER